MKQDPALQMKFSMEDERADAITSVVHVRGEVDLAVAGAFEECLVQLLEGGTKLLVVDLSAVSFLDSTGLGALVRAQRRAAERGAHVAVAGANENVAKVFTITGLDNVFFMHETVAAALSA